MTDYKEKLINGDICFPEVPKKLRTPELCKIAVTEYGYALECVPEKLKTYELCKLALKSRGGALEYVPEELRTPELCEIAVKDCCWALEFVPAHLKDEMRLVKENFNKVCVKYVRS